MRSAAAIVLAVAPVAAHADAEEGKSPAILGPEWFGPGFRDQRYAIPDLAPDKRLLPEVDTGLLTLQPGIELIVDWTGFGQDATSTSQVGRQGNLLEVRSASFELAGRLGPRLLLGYKIGIEYNGFDVDPQQALAVTDVAVNFAIPRFRATVHIGQMREDFGYEVVGSTATMPQSERVLSPFASPVNFGLKIVHVLGADDRMTLSYGVFRNSWGEGDGDAAFSGRVTRLVIDDPANRRFLHLGVGVRATGGDRTLRYRARPGVNAADDFADTGEFQAKGARHIGLEAHYADGPLSVIGEFVTAKITAPTEGNPRLHGLYLMGSWVLTGESRPYDRSRGVVRRITPEGRWGAPELLLRYAAVDLDGAAVRGGSYQRVEVGANWWATARWKAGVLLGRVWLDRFGETGKTTSVLTRIQWVY